VGPIKQIQKLLNEKFPEATGEQRKLLFRLFVEEYEEAKTKETSEKRTFKLFGKEVYTWKKQID